MANETELSSRVESATAPDRALDAEIALALGWECPGLTDEYREICKRQRWDLYLGLNWFAKDGPKGEISRHPFTASIDVALTLIPKYTPWCVGSNDGWPDERPFLARVGGPPFVFGATPALAIVAAALKGRGL